MAPLATTLAKLDALLEASDVPAVGEADKAIWEYCCSFDGISEQGLALRALSDAFGRRPGNSGLHSMVCNLIAQHQRRLGGTAT